MRIGDLRFAIWDWRVVFAMLGRRGRGDREGVDVLGEVKNHVVNGFDFFAKGLEMFGVIGPGGVQFDDALGEKGSVAHVAGDRGSDLKRGGMFGVSH